MDDLRCLAGQIFASGKATRAQSLLQVEDIRRAAEQAASRAEDSAASAAARAQTQEATADSTSSLKPHLQVLVNVLQNGLVERDTEARLLILAAISNEHILFIGPPGTAKSELGRRLSYLFSGQFFERLLTRFSVPEVSRSF